MKKTIYSLYAIGLVLQEILNLVAKRLDKLNEAVTDGR